MNRLNLKTASSALSMGLLLLCLAGRGVVPEVCDNAIDDDLDGLIDLNDDDCHCRVLEPTSLIPNPSFEEMSCCPMNRSSLDCAETWIQASDATTDYLHTCGWMGWENLPPPLPFPDGEACIGFRNGRFGGDNINPNWKEYTGACLTEPLRTGNEYRFEFYVGFTNPANSPPLNVVFYGSTDCKNLPFGMGNERHGCPLNGPGWIRLDNVYSQGANSWKKETFDVVPPQDIYAIAIGPDCVELLPTDNPYYFLDNLILADIKEFEFVIAADGHPCSPGFALQLPKVDTLNYQWYLDGVALIGMTSSRIEGDLGEGSYQVVIKGKETCRVTKPFHHVLPTPASDMRAFYCTGQTYKFNGQILASPGVFLDTLLTINGCDSIVSLTLEEAQHVQTRLSLKIFDGEVIKVGGREFTKPTEQDLKLTSRHGCDSIIDLRLQYYEVFVPSAFSPNGDGINDFFTIAGGPDLLRVSELKIFDRWGNQVFEGRDLDPQQGWDGVGAQGNFEQGVYTYIALVEMDDQRLHQLGGSVLLIH